MEQFLPASSTLAENVHQNQSSDKFDLLRHPFNPFVNKSTIILEQHTTLHKKVQSATNNLKTFCHMFICFKIHQDTIYPPFEPYTQASPRLDKKSKSRKIKLLSGVCL